MEGAVISGRNVAHTVLAALDAGGASATRS